MAIVFRVARRVLPAPVAGSLRRVRRRVVRLATGVDVQGAMQETVAVREEVLAGLEQRTLDLLARQDAVLASYDRRVAALTNRVLDLEGRAHGRSLAARARAAIDRDPQDAKLLEERLEQHVALLRDHAPVVDAGDDPLVTLEAQPERSAGAVTLVGVVEGFDLDDLDRLFGAVHRVLRPDGIVVVEALYPSSAESFARFWRHPARVRPWDSSAVAWLARQAGLEVVDVHVHPGPDGDYALVARRP